MSFNKVRQKNVKSHRYALSKYACLITWNMKIYVSYGSPLKFGWKLHISFAKLFFLFKYISFYSAKRHRHAGI